MPRNADVARLHDDECAIYDERFPGADCSCGAYEPLTVYLDKTRITVALVRLGATSDEGGKALYAKLMAAWHARSSRLYIEPGLTADEYALLERVAPEALRLA